MHIKRITSLSGNPSLDEICCVVEKGHYYGLDVLSFPRVELSDVSIDLSCEGIYDVTALSQDFFLIDLTRKVYDKVFYICK